MFPYYCRRPGMCPFFPMGYPMQYPMTYMNYGYPFPPLFDEIEEEHEHEHEFEHEHHRDEENTKEEPEENINEYRMAGPAAPPFIPGHPGPGQFTSPEEILRYIEFYQPDIIRAMVIRGIPIAEARRLVRRIIKITLRFCRPGRP